MASTETDQGSCDHLEGSASLSRRLLRLFGKRAFHLRADHLADEHRDANDDEVGDRRNFRRGQAATSGSGFHRSGRDAGDVIL
jgi:hypothetical protein